MSQKNRKNGGKKGVESHPLDVVSLSPETRGALATLGLLVLGILFALGAFDMAGVIGRGLNGLALGTLGRLHALLPAFLLFLVAARVRGVTLGIDAAVKLGVGLAILTLSSFIHLMVSVPDGVVFGKQLAEGGGYIGMLVAYLLERGLGFWGASVVLGAGLLASLLLVFKTSLGRIVMPHRVLFDVFKRQPKTERQDPYATMLPPSETPDAMKQAPLFASKEVAQDAAASETRHDGEAAEVQEPTLKKKVWRKVALPTDLLDNRASKPLSGDIKAHQHIIQKTLDNFGIPSEMSTVSVGPTVTQYTLKPADGIKLTRITALSNDLALSLAAHPIRIEAPIPGKSLVGIEVPNQAVAVVSLREVLESQEFRNVASSLRIALGKDVAGKPWVADLARMPHMLVAGATGSGKTVCLNSIILSLLYSNGPDELRLILVDPKRVELTAYNNIPHLLVPAITELPKTVNALRWAIGEMDRRFTLLSKFGKRDIGSYNAAMDEKLPYIVIVIDELADLMVSNMANEVETSIIRLAQMARAVGIHLILATQRPSVDVITGLIKANFTARIAFSVASATDSRTILDTTGAEKLVGRGDMLFTSAELSKPKRLQGTYVSDTEIKKVTDFIKDNGDAPDYQFEIIEKTGSGVTGGVTFDDGGDDPLLPDAKDAILRAGKASASFLQRRLKIGYARAARILDLLEEKGVIGPGDGAKPREILVARPAGMEAAPTDEEDEGDGSENGVPKWE